MICEHGNKVYVQIKPIDRECWDDGILQADDDQLFVFGCPRCKRIDFVELESDLDL